MRKGTADEVEKRLAFHLVGKETKTWCSMVAAISAFEFSDKHLCKIING